MSKGMPRAMSRGKPSAQDIVKVRVPIKNVAVSIAGTTGVGFGSVVVGDVPEGNLLLLGATAYLTLTGPTSASLDDTYDGDFSVGTTATADATLSGTDADIIASSALGAATAEVSPRVRATNAVQSVLDNTDGSLELNLNVIVDDANIGATVALTANGEIYLVFVMLGDD